MIFSNRSIALVAISILAAQLLGCGGSVASLSNEQLQTQLAAAEAEWKVTGKGVDEKDAAYIPDPKIQAAYQHVQAPHRKRDASEDEAVMARPAPRPIACANRAGDARRVAGLFALCCAQTPLEIRPRAWRQWAAATAVRSLRHEGLLIWPEAILWPSAPSNAARQETIIAKSACHASLASPNSRARAPSPPSRGCESPPAAAVYRRRFC